MSAFVVSRETMQVCVTALHDRMSDCRNADQLGRDLFALNEQAVNWRYPNGPQDVGLYAEWQWRVTCPLVDGNGIPVDRKTACQWLKALHCLRYQLTEGEKFETHNLYKRIMERIRQIETSIVCQLPEYNEAPWDFRPYQQVPAATEADAAPGLLELLTRLANAAAARDNTTGDPCNLIAAREELTVAIRAARAAIAKVEAGQ